MGSTQNTVRYCSISSEKEILCSYDGGDPSTENLAALCLEKTPSFHKWYFESIGKTTFVFLMEDGLVYFTIVDEGLGRSCVLKFLENLRDEFKQTVKRNSRGSFSGTISCINVQDQFAPAIHRLIASLERATETTQSDSSHNLAEQSNMANSTKAQFLGKEGKDHVISLRGNEVEEHRKSTERENKTEGSHIPPTATSLQKEYVPRRGRSNSQSMERKWRRQLQIVVVFDVAICLMLFGIWLAICHGIKCTRP